MSSNAHCPDCGQPIPPDAPRGACPACLLEGGLEPPPDPNAPVTPSTADLSASFPDLEFLEVLGRGGMGVVYKARQKELDRVIALKVLPPAVRDQREFADRFAREARALARLDHPHIVRVYEFGERDGVYFLVMEYVDGVTLREAMEEAGLEPDEALGIVPQICDALQYAHDQGVVHRDIKPENVLLGKDGSVKVADFGLAKLSSRPGDGSTLTRAGQVMGTLHYMAPEQIETPSSVDHRADIYSLGVVFYEMLTGDLPLGRFDPPSERVQVDVRIDKVVLRALEKKRERRYQKAQQVKTDVDALSDAEAPATPSPVRHAPPAAGPPPAPRTQPAPEPEAEPGPRLCRSAVAGLAIGPAALCLAIVIGIVMLGSDRGPSDSWMVAMSSLGLMAGMGVIISLASWLRIRKQPAALRGKGFAVAGTLLPLLWAPAVLGILYQALDVERKSREWQTRRTPGPWTAHPGVHSRPPTRPATSTAGTSRVFMWTGQTYAPGPAAEITAKIRHALDGLALRMETTEMKLEDAADFLRAEDAKSLLAMPAEELDRGYRAGRFGLAYINDEIVPESLSDMDVYDVRLGAGKTPATVTLSSSIWTLRFPMAREDGEWKFALGQVSRSRSRSAGSGNAPSAATLPGVPSYLRKTSVVVRLETGEIADEDYTAAVSSGLERLLDGLRAHLKEARSYVQTKGLYDLHDYEVMESSELPEVRDEQARGWQLGMPMVPPDSLPEPFENFELRDVLIGLTGRQAVVSVESAGWRLTFPAQMVGTQWVCETGLVTKRKLEKKD